MFYQKLMVVVLSLTLSAMVIAQGNNFSASNAELLVSSCREALNVYATKENMKTTARLTTSLSEAVRAGYCIGVIQQYLASQNYCYGYITSWRAVAQVIAEADDFNLPNDAQSLLEVAACD